jgi:hypothetical protein
MWGLYMAAETTSESCRAVWLVVYAADKPAKADLLWKKKHYTKLCCVVMASPCGGSLESRHVGAMATGCVTTKRGRGPGSGKWNGPREWWAESIHTPHGRWSLSKYVFFSFLESTRIIYVLYTRWTCRACQCIPEIPCRFASAGSDGWSITTGSCLQLTVIDGVLSMPVRSFSRQW